MLTNMQSIVHFVLLDFCSYKTDTHLVAAMLKIRIQEIRKQQKIRRHHAPGLVVIIFHKFL